MQLLQCLAENGFFVVPETKKNQKEKQKGHCDSGVVFWKNKCVHYQNNKFFKSKNVSKKCVRMIFFCFGFMMMG